LTVWRQSEKFVLYRDKVCRFLHLDRNEKSSTQIPDMVRLRRLGIRPIADQSPRAK